MAIVVVLFYFAAKFLDGRGMSSGFVGVVEVHRLPIWQIECQRFAAVRVIAMIVAIMVMTIMVVAVMVTLFSLLMIMVMTIVIMIVMIALGAYLGSNDDHVDDPDDSDTPEDAS